MVWTCRRTASAGVAWKSGHLDTQQGGRRRSWCRCARDGPPTLTLGCGWPQVASYDSDNEPDEGLVGRTGSQSPRGSSSEDASDTTYSYASVEEQDQRRAGIECVEELIDMLLGVATNRGDVPADKGIDRRLLPCVVREHEGWRVEGLPEGHGKAVLRDGQVYQGEFCRGLMHGRGRLEWADGVVYRGTFVRNQISGEGVYEWLDGSRYEGEVLNGYRHGRGTFWCGAPAYGKYEGDWVEGVRHGQGTMTYGVSWEEDVARKEAQGTNGEGAAELVAGVAVYDGAWRHDSKHGWGTMHYASGNVFQGYWMNNVKHGEGTMLWVDRNEQYVGEWRNGAQHGKGEHIWYQVRTSSSQFVERNRYVGEWKFGLREGLGEFFYASGAQYRGEWAHGIKHGQGAMLFEDGSIWEGQFVEDEMVDDQGRIVGTPSTATLPGGALGTGSSLRLLWGVDSRIQHVLLRHVSHLRRVYKFYSMLGQLEDDLVYCMDRMALWRLLCDAQIPDGHNVTLASVDRLLAAPWRLAPIRKERWRFPHAPEHPVLIRDLFDCLVRVGGVADMSEDDPDQMAIDFEAFISRTVKPVLRWQAAKIEMEERKHQIVDILLNDPKRKAMKAMLEDAVGLNSARETSTSGAGGGSGGGAAFGSLDWIPEPELARLESIEDQREDDGTQKGGTGAAGASANGEEGGAEEDWVKSAAMQKELNQTMPDHVIFATRQSGERRSGRKRRNRSSGKAGGSGSGSKRRGLSKKHKSKSKLHLTEGGGGADGGSSQGGGGGKGNKKKRKSKHRQHLHRSLQKGGGGGGASKGAGSESLNGSASQLLGLERDAGAEGAAQDPSTVGGSAASGGGSGGRGPETGAIGYLSGKLKKKVQLSEQNLADEEAFLATEKTEETLNAERRLRLALMDDVHLSLFSSSVWTVIDSFSDMLWVTFDRMAHTNGGPGLGPVSSQGDRTVSVRDLLFHLDELGFFSPERAARIGLPVSTRYLSVSVVLHVLEMCCQRTVSLEEQDQCLKKLLLGRGGEEGSAEAEDDGTEEDWGEEYLEVFFSGQEKEFELGRELVFYEFVVALVGIANFLFCIDAQGKAGKAVEVVCLAVVADQGGSTRL